MWARPTGQRGGVGFKYTWIGDIVSISFDVVLTLLTLLTVLTGYSKGGLEIPRAWGCIQSVLALSLGMRVVLHTSAVLVGMALLTGCGGSLGDPREVVTFASWGATQDQMVYTEMNARFEAAHPDVRTSLMLIPFANYFTKLQLLLIGHVAPDVATVSAGMAYQLKNNGYLMDLSPFIERERLTDPAFLTEKDYTIDLFRPMCELDGRMYYIPIGPMSFHIYYNKDLFVAAGVPYPAEGWTWADFLDAARRTTKNKDGRMTSWGMLCPNWPDIWRIFIMQNGGDLFDDWTRPTRCTLDTPEAIEAMRFYLDLVHKWKVAPTPQQMTQNVATDFMTGRLAMIMHGTWMVEQYRTLTQFQWDMAPLPVGKRYATLTSVGGYAITSQTKNPELAWMYLRNFLSEDTQRLMSTDCSLWQPILRKAADDGHMAQIPGVPEHHNLRFSELARSTPLMPLHHPNASRIEDLLVSETDPMFLGKEEVETGMKRVTAAINAVLNEGSAGE